MQGVGLSGSNEEKSEEEKIKELSKMLGGEDNIEEGKQLALKLIRTQTN